MKTNLKYFAFLIVTFLLFKGDAFALTCNYNISGYTDDELYWVVDSTKSKPATGKKHLGGGVLGAGTEPVLNWDSATGGYKALDDINSGTCPSYLVQTYMQDYHGFNVYLSNSSSLNSIVNSVQKTDILKADKSVIVFKLANRKKSSSVAVTCSYVYPTDSNYNFNLLYDTEGNLIGTDDEDHWYQINMVLSYTAYEEKLEPNSCNINAYRCYDSEVGAVRVYLNSSGFLNEDQTFSADNAMCPKYDFSYDTSSSSFNNPLQETTACKWYGEYKTELVTAAQKYNSCNKSDGTCGSAMQEFNQAEKKLSTFCKSIYNVAYYSDSCVQQCTKMEEEVAQIKDANGINSSESSNANCGLSARLAAWILKIINWMRYIVPVLLILLSVLDFIKAIAADSEDEIKKVASKFIKRLIVAVIIFILPLALEFLLGVFGRDANNFCL